MSYLFTSVLTDITAICNKYFFLITPVCSQAVEQNNRTLKRLVSSVSYMKPTNFKRVLTIFMSAQNFMRRIDELQGDGRDAIEYWF